MKLAINPTAKVGNIVNAPNHHFGILVNFQTYPRHEKPAASPTSIPPMFARRTNIPSRNIASSIPNEIDAILIIIPIISSSSFGTIIAVVITATPRTAISGRSWVI